MAGGRVHISHASPIPLDAPLSPDHKLQKTSKGFGIFQSPGIFSFVLLYLKAESKKEGGWHNAFFLNIRSCLCRSLRLGSCEQIISSFKGLRVYKRRSEYCVRC